RIPRALDHDLRDGCELQLLLHVSANRKIAVKTGRQFLRRRVPARPPITVHAESESNRINFLSHKNLFLGCFRSLLLAFLRPGRLPAPFAVFLALLALPLSRFARSTRHSVRQSVPDVTGPLQNPPAATAGARR